MTRDELRDQLYSFVELHRSKDTVYNITLMVMQMIDRYVAERKREILTSLSAMGSASQTVNFDDPVQSRMWMEGWQLAHEVSRCGHVRGNWQCDEWPTKEWPTRCLACERERKLVELAMAMTDTSFSRSNPSKLYRYPVPDDVLAEFKRREEK